MSHLFDEEDLLDRLMGDDALARRVVECFLIDIPGQLASLADALKNADSKDTRFKAHSIKGAAANAGLIEVQSQAERLERLGEQGDLCTAREVLPRLLNEVAQASPILRDFCARQH